MANCWKFPSNNFGTLTGIGEAGIETFKGTPYRSLAREICQNSMDARNDYNKPVIVEFKKFILPNKDIPGYDKLKDAIESCLKFWIEQKNKKTVDFFKNANAVINKENISVLRISDYNTKGLQGSDKEYNTPWHNLVRAVGVSGKEGSDGGSFGIGKSAPFVCSDLRTLFYATKDIDGLSAFQGIARLVSFKEKGFFGKEIDSMTTGTGYYSSDKRNNPLRECISIDLQYKRIDYGTDIFIMGFNESSDWKTEIIISVLEEFLIAIYNNEMIVKVEDVEISSKNLEKIVEEYKELAKIAYNYFQVLTNENSIIIEHKLPELGTIELRVLISQGLHRKVMMCRKNGMKIFDKANISSTIQFAGICILKDEMINSYFRNMENPQHNAWEPARSTIHSKSKAEKNMKMLYKYVKDSIIEQGRHTTVDEIDAEGMGEYFADTEFINTENQNKSEAISDVIKDFEIKVAKLQKEQIGYEKVIEGNTSYPEEYDFDKYDENYGGLGSKDMHDEENNMMHNGTGYGNAEGDNAGTNGVGNNHLPTNINNFDDESRASQIGVMSVRLFLSDKNSNIYTLIFTPKKTFGSGFLKISLSGEQKNVKATIISAEDLENDKILLCKEDRIYLENIVCNKKHKVSFCLEYLEECSLEVKLYGYSK